MRSIEQQTVALECLRLACSREFGTLYGIDAAEKFYAFVTGQEQDDAKRKLDAVRDAISE